jgi:DNA-binding transcriptional LysR family regulator
VQSLSRSATLQALRDGSLDFAVGFFSSKSTDIDMRRLRLETYLMVARPQHPIWQAPLTLDRYCAASHILVSSDGSFDGIVDQQLQELGKSRTVSLAIPSFISALIILAQTDFLCTLPALVVEQHAATFGLRTAKPPLEIRPFEVSLLSHRRNEKSPLHQWCRDKMLT